MPVVKEGQRISILNQAMHVTSDEFPEAGAPSRYSIRVALPPAAGQEALTVELPFQRGTVGADGGNINGISDEVLLEVLIHRLAVFQSGAWACEDNGTALSHLRSALGALEARSAKRRSAGVDGTTAKVPPPPGDAR